MNRSFLSRLSHIAQFFLAPLLLTFWQSATTDEASAAAAPVLSLTGNGDAQRLSWLLSSTNGSFFILRANQPDVFKSGEVFFHGDATVANHGSLPLPKEQNIGQSFFGLLQDTDLTFGPLEESISDEPDPIPDDYFYITLTEPVALVANTAFQLAIQVSNGSLEPVAVDGELELFLFNDSGDIVDFSYSITPASLPVTSGLSTGTVTIATESSLETSVLAASFIPHGQQPLRDRKSLRLGQQSPRNSSVGILTKPANARRLRKNVPLVPLQNYQASDPVNWLYPLPKPYPLTGTFGEWPGHSAIHWGVDGGAGPGELVRPAKRGIVVGINGAGTGLGQYVAIDHGNGYGTVYMHINPLLIRAQTSKQQALTHETVVETGDVIGTIAPITRIGPHLHFELRSLGTSGSNYRYRLISGDRKVGNLSTWGTHVNPISRSGQFKFTPAWTKLDSGPPSVKSVYVLASDPSETSLVLNPANPVEGDGNLIGYRYFVFQIVDEQDGPQGANYYKLTPDVVTFSAAGKPPASFDYEQPEDSISAMQFETYAMLPQSEQNPANNSVFRTSRYKYWFAWDTSAYAADPAGPRFAGLTIEDVAGKTTVESYFFGPKIDFNSQALKVPEEGETFDFPVRSAFGPLPNQGIVGTKLDAYSCSISVTPTADWKAEFDPIASLEIGAAAPQKPTQLQFDVTGHDEIRHLKVRISPVSQTPSAGTLVVAAASSVFPDLRHEVSFSLLKLDTLVDRVEIVEVSPIVVQGKSITLHEKAFDSQNGEVTVSPMDWAWSSSNFAIASVDRDGVVTGQGEGTATIAVMHIPSGKVATVTVTVAPPATPPTVSIRGAQDSNGGYRLTLKRGSEAPLPGESGPRYGLKLIGGKWSPNSPYGTVSPGDPSVLTTTPLTASQANPTFGFDLTPVSGSEGPKVQVFYGTNVVAEAPIPSVLVLDDYAKTGSFSITLDGKDYGIFTQSSAVGKIFDISTWKVGETHHLSLSKMSQNGPLPFTVLCLWLPPWFQFTKGTYHFADHDEVTQLNESAPCISFQSRGIASLILFYAELEVQRTGP